MNAIEFTATTILKLQPTKAPRESKATPADVYKELNRIAALRRYHAKQAEKKAAKSWICLACKSSKPGVHGFLDDGITPCYNKGK